MRLLTPPIVEAIVSLVSPLTRETNTTIPVSLLKAAHSTSLASTRAPAQCHFRQPFTHPPPPRPRPQPGNQAANTLYTGKVLLIHVYSPSLYCHRPCSCSWLCLCRARIRLETTLHVDASIQPALAQTHIFVIEALTMSTRLQLAFTDSVLRGDKSWQCCDKQSL